jgi:hypothetical protein
MVLVVQRRQDSAQPRAVARTRSLLGTAEVANTRASSVQSQPCTECLSYVSIRQETVGRPESVEWLVGQKTFWRTGWKVWRWRCSTKAYKNWSHDMTSILIDMATTWRCSWCRYQHVKIIFFNSIRALYTRWFFLSARAACQTRVPQNFPER